MMPHLRFVDDSLKSSFQESLSLMRKNRLFCDVILHVSTLRCRGGVSLKHFVRRFKAESMAGVGEAPPVRNCL